VAHAISRPKALLTAAALLTIVAVASGCTPGPQQPNGISTPILPAAAIKLRGGGVATVAVPYLPANFNPSVPSGANPVTQMVMQQVWPSAVVVDPTFNPVPTSSATPTSVFDSTELISISPQTVQYKIDTAAVWSDGTPVTASDLVYNWHEQLAYGGSLPFPGALAGYEDIASITGSDKGKLANVVFKHPYADWEGLFSDLVPAHVGNVIGWDGFTDGNVSDVVSAGPFAVASFVPGHELVLVRNKRWWGSTAHLNEIVFRVVRGDAAVWAGLEHGSLDVAMVPTSPSVPAAATAHDLTASTSLSPMLWQLCFNLSDAVVGRSVMRRALALSIDRSQLVDDTIGLADPGIPVAENRLFMQAAPGADLGAAQYSDVDLTTFASLMGTAGYKLSSDGYYDAAGTPLVLTITAPSGDPLVTSMESVLQAEMKAAGLTVVFDNVPLTKLLGSVLPNHSYEIALVPYYLPVYQSWTAPQYGTPDAPAAARAAADAAARAGFETTDVSDLTDHAIADLYSEAGAQLELPTARGLYNEINTLLWTDLPTIPLFQQPVTLVTTRALVNVEEGPTWAGMMWNAEDWGYAVNLPKESTSAG
jgi:peptide/nickel transport system substrate-binding protein